LCWSNLYVPGCVSAGDPSTSSLYAGTESVRSDFREPGEQGPERGDGHRAVPLPHPELLLAPGGGTGQGSVPAPRTQSTQRPVHGAFYSKAVKTSSKPFPSLASADGDKSRHWQRWGGGEDPAWGPSQQHGGTWGSAPQKAKGLPARRGRRRGEEGRALPWPAPLLPLFTRRLSSRSPEACRDGDVPLQTPQQAAGQRRGASATISCLAREGLSAPREARPRLLVWHPTPWHGPTTGLQFGVEAPTASEWGQGMEAGKVPAGRRRLESRPGGKGSLFGRRLGHIPARGRGAAAIPESLAGLPAGSQPSPKGVTSCASRPW